MITGEAETVMKQLVNLLPADYLLERDGTLHRTNRIEELGIESHLVVWYDTQRRVYRTSVYHTGKRGTTERYFTDNVEVIDYITRFPEWFQEFKNAWVKFEQQIKEYGQ